jgi:hypothetical protein
MQAEGGIAGDQAYRPISLMAVLSVVLGALSLLTAFGWLFALVPIAGIVLALVALQRIRQAPNELTGIRVAKAGLFVSLGAWLVGTVCLLLVRASEVPRGYEAITFDQLQPDPDKKGQLVPPQALTWQEKQTRLFIKGYMYPGGQASGIKKFILVPSLEHCAFCRQQLRSTQMIYVTLTGDHTARLKSIPVGVGGILKVDTVAAASPLGGFPYHLQADYFQ